MGFSVNPVTRKLWGNPMKTAYSYIRFSTKGQATGDSTRRQLKLTEEFCKRHGLSLSLETFADEGVSGFKGKNRAKGKLGSFLALVEDGKIASGSWLVVESIDRLGRDELTEMFGLYGKLLGAGITLATTTPERIYTPAMKNDLGACIEFQCVAFRANEESRVKSERGKARWEANRLKIATRKPITKNCPSWLRLVDGKWQAQPDAVKTIKYIFDLLANGYGVYRIAQRLNKEGVKSIAKKEQWREGFIAKLASNKALLGEFQPQVRTQGGREAIGDPVANYYPIILTEKEFYTARQAMESRKISGVKRTGKGNPNLFTGLIHDCRDGSKMKYIPEKGNRASHLISQGREQGTSSTPSFPYARFENAFLAFLTELTPADILPKAAIKANKTDSIIGEIAKLDSKISELKSAMDSADSIKPLIEKLKEWENRRKSLQSDLEAEKARQPIETADLAITQSLGALLGSSNDQDGMRTKLKAGISRIVTECHLLVYKMLVAGSNNRPKTTRACIFQVHFANGSWRSISLYEDETFEIDVAIEKKALKAIGDLREYKGQLDKPISLEGFEKLIGVR